MELMSEAKCSSPQSPHKYTVVLPRADAVPKSEPMVSADSEWSLGGLRIVRAMESHLDSFLDLLKGLSIESVYQRFHTGGLSKILLAEAGKFLEQGDHQLSVVVVSGSVVIGHGILGRATGKPGSADIGILVADNWQGRGIGSQVVKSLILDEWSSDLKAAEFSYITGNAPVLKIAKSYQGDLAFIFDHGVISGRIENPRSLLLSRLAQAI